MPVPPEPETKPFMTYIPTREPQWKQHKNIGQAKNAIIGSVSGGHGPGSGWYHMKKADIDNLLQVYELVDGHWKLLWEIPKNTLKSELPWAVK